MDSVIAVFSFLIGCSVGSFLNVCIYRMPRRMSVILPSSRCPDCREKIRARDNIPLVSFLLLKGRCRNCGVHISLRYPMVELVSGVLTVCVFWHFDFTVVGFAAAVLIYILIVIFFVDLEFQIIPDRVILTGVTAGLGFQVIGSYMSWWNVVIGGIIGGGFLLFTALLGKLIFRKDSMGGGDIKLGIMLGIFLGIQNSIVCLFSAFIYAALFGGGRMILRGKMPVGEIPFGPFLAFGAVTGLFFGSNIVQVYYSWLWL